MTISFFAVFLLLGAITGFLAGLFGIGGGLIVVPALVYILPLLGIPNSILMSVTLATSFSTIVVTSFGSAQRHYKLGNIQWNAIKILVPTLMITTYLASGLITQLDRNIVSKLFAVLMLYLSIRMFRSIKVTVQDKSLTPLSALVGGVSIGLASSAAGIGGGGLLVPFLNERGISIKKSIGTSAICSMLLGLSGTIGYIRHGWNVADLPEYSLGYVYLPALLGITLASFFTSKLGASATSKLPVATLKRYFALLLVVIAINMFMK